MKLYFTLLTETKTCYRFQNGTGATMMTLYLKKDAIKDAGINPKMGVTVTVDETEEGGK
jgi:hypothetical protein